MLISNPIHTGAKEPTAWYEMGVLMKQAKKRVKIHTPYIICNDMMYDTWSDVAANVPEFTVMTNSVANNGNPFGSADYQKIGIGSAVPASQSGSMRADIRIMERAF